MYKGNYLVLISQGGVLLMNQGETTILGRLTSYNFSASEELFDGVLPCNCQTTSNKASLLHNSYHKPNIFLHHMRPECI